MDLYIDSIELGIRFTFDEYLIARKKCVEGNWYYLTHSDGTKQRCLLDYFPLPRYRDMRVLVEFGRDEKPYSRKNLYWKEVPLRYLTKNTP